MGKLPGVIGSGFSLYSCLFSANLPQCMNHIIKGHYQEPFSSGYKLGIMYFSYQPYYNYSQLVDEQTDALQNGTIKCLAFTGHSEIVLVFYCY